MGLSVEAVAVAKTYTDNSIKGISGTLAGKNCTIKSITKDNDISVVTFEWTADDGTNKTTSMQIKDGENGVSVIGVTQMSDDKFVFNLSDGTQSEPIVISTSKVTISQESGNALVKKDDGLYVSSTDIEISKEDNNAISTKADGLYVKNIEADIANKVDKIDGKSLVSDADIAQIIVNKSAINVLNADDNTENSIRNIVKKAIGETLHLTKKVLDHKPTVEEAIEEVIYLVPTNNEGIYNQYMKIENKIIDLNNTEVNLSEYAKLSDIKFDIMPMNVALTESDLLDKLVEKEGIECSGFFYNADTNEYCEFEGLYDNVKISGEIIHFGYCHIKGLHKSDYSVDYLIDDEDGDTWYKRTAIDYIDLSNYVTVQQNVSDKGKALVIGNDGKLKPSTIATDGGVNVNIVEFTKAQYDALSEPLEEGTHVLITDDEDPTGNNNRYSTGEVEVGTWIDGKKIYRKCILNNYSISKALNWETVIDIADLNIDNVINVIGKLERGGTIRDINFIDSTTVFGSYRINNNNTTFQYTYPSYASGYVNRFIFVFIEYTKTTD